MIEYKKLFKKEYHVYEPNYQAPHSAHKNFGSMRAAKKCACKFGTGSEIIVMRDISMPNGFKEFGRVVEHFVLKKTYQTARKE